MRGLIYTPSAACPQSFPFLACFLPDAFPFLAALATFFPPGSAFLSGLPRTVFTSTPSSDSSLVAAVRMLSVSDPRTAHSRLCVRDIELNISHEMCQLV